MPVQTLGWRDRSGQQGTLLAPLITYLPWVGALCRPLCPKMYSLRWRTHSKFASFWFSSTGSSQTQPCPWKGSTFCASPLGCVRFADPCKQPQSSQRGRRQWGRAPRGPRPGSRCSDIQTAFTMVQSLPTELVD